MTSPIAALNTPETLLLDLARKRFRIDTLQIHNAESLDFHQVVVWAIRSAMEHAYSAGQRSVAAANPTVDAVRRMRTSV